MKRTLSCLLVLALVLSLFTFSTSAASRSIITTPTGYTSASDVDYVTQRQSNKTVVVNWGARGENCLFLSTYAEDYYVGSYTYETLSSNSGGSTQSNASNSDLYRVLQSMMKAKHSYITSYDATRDFYQYTDCVSNDYGTLSSFYSGKIVDGTWDSGKTYNREHTWPNSKGLGGSDENDIMMLRPTIPSENGSRGNKSYGESSGFFDPGVDVRGDCARIALYVYTRWGNTSYMWGQSGVIESLDILLKWMEEDPVDTWEMGRNDSVQSITGVRNVFVDYPELAWLLFGEEVPSGMTTPSGGTGSGSTTCSHSQTKLVDAVNATCTTDGYTGDTRCADCNKKLQSGSTISATGHKDNNGDDKCDTCGASTETPGTSGGGYVKVTDGTLTSGQYVLVTGNGYAPGVLDGTWISCVQPVISGNSVTNAKGAVWTLTVTGSSVVLTDANGVSVAPKGGNTNGIQSGEYKWSWSYDSTGGGFVFAGTGSDTVRLAANTDPDTGGNKYRAYKVSTVTGNYAEKYPACFTLYKLTSGEAVCTHSWGTGTVTTQPDCETAGVRTYTCSACKQTKTEAIAATGHAEELRSEKKATCTVSGYSGDIYCKTCNARIKAGSTVAATGHIDNNENDRCDSCDADLSSGCMHRLVQTKDDKAAACDTAGYTGDTYCRDCGAKLSSGVSIPATGHADAKGDNLCDNCGADMNSATADPSVPPTEDTTPPTGESVPPTTDGTVTTVPATGPATVPSEDIPAMNTGSDPDDSSPAVWIVIGAVILLAAGIAVFIIVKKKKATEE